jgi:acyl-CoA reductase-like NAD-dependent aldehyde dehydrogenase
MSPTKQTTITPHSQEPLVTYDYPSIDELDAIVSRSVTAQKLWKNTPIEERLKIGQKFTVSDRLCGGETSN